MFEPEVTRMDKTDSKLREDVKRLVDSMNASLSVEELGKIDPAALQAVREHVSPAPRRRTIDPRWISANSPFTMVEFEARVDKICGCEGRCDCDCVSVFNKANVALWTEHNTRDSLSRVA
jgi:hypothetical protein